MKLQAPKGTRDFYPPEMAVRNWIMQQWQAVSRRHGFVEYDGPIFEELDLYRVKSGDEIVSQLFHFEDRGGRQLAIRPEMTPTLARMVAARANALGKPIKWFSQPRLCRAERPQRGRLREFFQWNIDILGEDGPIADAECVFVAADFFRAIGLDPQQVQLRLNSRALVQALLETTALPADRHAAVLAALDKRDKLDAADFSRLLDDLALSADQRRVVDRMGEARVPEGLALIEPLVAGHARGVTELGRLREVLDLLKTFGVGGYCTFHMGVVRGLAYYTGLVFEAFGQGGLKRAVAGGGRYDRLLSALDGPAMGAVGFATSDVVIQDLLGEFGRLPQLTERCDVFVIDSAADRFAEVLAICGSLRAGGVNALFAYQRQNVGKQFKQAAQRGARHVIIVEPGTPEQLLTVKEMATGTQRQVSRDELLRDIDAPRG